MKVFNRLLRVLGVGVSCVSLAVIAFGVLFLTIGVVPYIQEVYVTTAMTTLHHKWLATLVVPGGTIERIMEKSRVDTSYLSSAPLVIPPLELSDPLPPLEPTAAELPLAPGLPQIVPFEERVYPGYEELSGGTFFKQVSGVGWVGYLLLVQDPARVYLAQTRQQFKRGDRVMDMVAVHEALAGVNAGGFNDGPNYDSNGGVPDGIVIHEGELSNPEPGDERVFSLIGFTRDNQLTLQHYTARQALEAGVRDAVSFEPFLIVNGETVIKEGTGGWGIAPRTAIGQLETGEVIFLLIDGRQVHSVGADIKVVQDVLYDEGCINAALMDGGSSSALYFKGEYLNKPSLGHERYINTAWLIRDSATW